MAQHACDATVKQRRAFEIHGAVQGVGFRPFVFRLAQELHLAGIVQNNGAGVTIEIEGDDEMIRSFRNRLLDERPALSIIKEIAERAIPTIGEDTFRIVTSDRESRIEAFILPDIAVCDDCLREMSDPTDRRYLYPFVNCTNCGPRFSIVEALPYDRPNTSMRRFAMCDACKAEYQNPLDRRFHAQPIACPHCGPSIELWSHEGKPISREREALQAAAEQLRDGKIVALKGIGGFQLLVDAANDRAVERLRRRKRREEKPFALMYPTIEHAIRDCDCSDVERRLLTSPAAPIVLLTRRQGASVSEAVAPLNPYLGIMLPYSPLHHLLLREIDSPIVATSGNISDEPMCFDESEAISRLNGIADCFLVHDRPIVRYVDDSIARVIDGEPFLLRRARGYAPLPVTLHADSRNGIDHPVRFAFGAHLKNTIALHVGDSVFLSQHIGDLSTVQATNEFEKIVEHFTSLYEAPVAEACCDLHPDYHSSAAARRYGRTRAFQHHVAHVAACYAENGVEGDVLGVAWDGTGLGDDGTIWGGEFFSFSENGYRRVAHLRTFPLSGGELAIREPRRSAIGMLFELFGDDAFSHPSVGKMEWSATQLTVVRTALRRAINMTRTSSCGRFFDAVASILEVKQRTSFEGQAAMMLEWISDSNERDLYPFRFSDTDPIVVDFQPMIEAIFADQTHRVQNSIIAARFHNTLASIIVEVAKVFKYDRVVLSGGCFQNKFLLDRTVALLRDHQIEPYRHRAVPTNDGGIAFGQIALASFESTRDRNTHALKPETEQSCA